MKPAIVMQTDFTRDTADVSTMYGVCLMVDSELRIYDNVHSIPNFDTYQASLALKYVVDFWEPGTIFVSVVDPGVGTKRRACVAKLINGSYVITPDNGSLTHLKKYFGIEEVRVIDEKTNRLPSTNDVCIFQGRDLFSYCAARLAAGVISFSDVGDMYPVDDIIEHIIIEPYEKEGKLLGMISSADEHFGLVCSNIPYKLFKQREFKYGDLFEVNIFKNDQCIYHSNVTMQPSFGYVEAGQPVIVVGETQEMEIAINMENLTRIYGIGCGSNWTISFKKLERS